MTSTQHTQMNATGLRVGKHFGPGGKYLLETLVQVLDEPASAMQLFGGNPSRYWCSSPKDDPVRNEQADRFVAASAHLYKVVHAVYLTNIGVDPQKERGYRMSVNSLVNHLEWADRMSCDSVVFHPGSPKEYPLDDSMQWAEEALREVLSRYDGPVKLLMENAAHKKKLGGIVEKTILPLWHAIDDERLGICIDTTHGYAAGYDIDTMASWFGPAGLLNGICELVHFNTPDDGVEKGSQLDRHSSTFDDGAFSLADIQTLFMTTKHLPLILEGTPSLSSDLVHFLRWEMEYRETGDVTVPKPGREQLGDIFSLADVQDAGQIP